MSKGCWFFFNQSEGIRLYYPILYERGTGKYNAKQVKRSKQFSDDTKKSAWWVFIYQVVDWDFSKIDKALHTSVGEVFQFASLKTLWDEYQNDLQEIEIKNIK